MCAYTAARAHVYATWQLAETLHARGRTLQAFLLLYALLHPPPPPPPRLHDDDNNNNNNNNNDDNDNDNDDNVAHVHVYFAPHTRRDEVETRVRAVEYLLHSVDDDDAAPHTTRHGDGEAQPRRRQRGAQERLALAQELLAPLFDTPHDRRAYASVDCCCDDYNDTSGRRGGGYDKRTLTSALSSPSAAAMTWPAPRHAAACVGNDDYFSVANVTPLVWQATPFTLRASVAHDDDNDSDDKDNNHNTDDNATVTVCVATAHACALVPVALLLRAYALQATIAQRRQQYTRAYAWLRAAMQWLRAAFAPHSVRQAECDLYDELHTRIAAAAATTTTTTTHSSNTTPTSLSSTSCWWRSEETTRRALQAVLTRECAYGEAMLATQLCALLHAMWTHSDAPPQPSRGSNNNTTSSKSSSSKQLQLLYAYASSACAALARVTPPLSCGDSDSIACVLHARCLSSWCVYDEDDNHDRDAPRRRRCCCRCASSGARVGRFDVHATATMLRYYRDFACVALLYTPPSASAADASTRMRVEAVWRQLAQRCVVCSDCRCNSDNSDNNTTTTSSSEFALLRQLFAFDAHERVVPSCRARDERTTRKRARADDGEACGRGVCVSTTTLSWLSPCVRRVLQRLLVWLRCVHGVTAPRVMHSNDDDNNSTCMYTQAHVLRERLLTSVLRSVDEATLRLSAAADTTETHGDAAAMSRLCTRVQAEVRLLVRVKAVALLTATACALTQLDVASAVRQLHAAQQYVSLFAPHTHALRADVHVLTACVASTLALRDRRPLQTLLPPSSSSLSPHVGCDSTRPAMRARSSSSNKNDDEEALLCEVVGLPYAHLCAAAAACAATSSATRLLVDLCKAWTLCDAAVHGYCLHLQPTQREAGDGDRDATSTTNNKNSSDNNNNNNNTTTTLAADAASHMHVVTRLALSQRRRCAAALRTRLRALQASYRASHAARDGASAQHDDVDDDDDNDAGDDDVAATRRLRAWMPVHVVLLRLLQGVVALSEEHSTTRAVRCVRAATHEARRCLGTYSPLVADGLRLLAHVCRAAAAATTNTATATAACTHDATLARHARDAARAALVARHVATHTNHAALLHLQRMRIDDNDKHNDSSNNSGSGVTLPAPPPAPDMHVQWRAQLEQLLLPCPLRVQLARVVCALPS